MSDNDTKEVDANELKFVDPIRKSTGERLVIRGGRDYDVPVARIVDSTFVEAVDGEKAVYISQGRNGISLSLESLEAIIGWAKEASEQV